VCNNFLDFGAANVVNCLCVYFIGGAVTGLGGIASSFPAHYREKDEVQVLAVLSIKTSEFPI